MDEFSERILVALVEGYNARAGLKDRNRALTEYEIARRAGYTGFSYVEFSTSPERDQVRTVLDELARGGMIREWARAGRYDSFVPTELGQRRASTFEMVREGSAEREAALGWVAAAPDDALAARGEGGPRATETRAGPAGDVCASFPERPGPAARSVRDAPPLARSSLFRRPILGSAGGPLTAEAALNRLVEQLDEALALLRAIDAKLGRDR